MIRHDAAWLCPRCTHLYINHLGKSLLYGENELRNYFWNAAADVCHEVGGTAQAVAVIGVTQGRGMAERLYMERLTGLEGSRHGAEIYSAFRTADWQFQSAPSSTRM